MLPNGISQRQKCTYYRVAQFSLKKIRTFEDDIKLKKFLRYFKNQDEIIKINPMEKEQISMPTA